MFRKTTALFLAVSLMIVSVSAASASGSGLFHEMMETEYTDERLEVLEKVADTISVSRTEDSVTVEVGLYR